MELDSAINSLVDEVTEGQILSEPPPPRAPIVGDSDIADEGPLARQGEVLAQRYVIKRLIAKGGMGRVYLATQTPLGREVAVKCLIPQPNDKEFRKRFFLEASTCARLTHRHIVTVHDYGEADNGELFMAMEYLRGEPMSRVVAREARLSNSRTGTIALQICRALRAAHRIGVVHRDLKPGNIMLLRDEEQDIADFIKVLDFGLVKAYQTIEGIELEGADLTRAGTWLGSPRYMAPEQIRCRDVDPRTDIYSLGAILFHMLAGRPPFTGATSVEIFGQHLRDPVPWIREIGGPSDVATELEQVVRRCLEKDPDRRYQSMDDLIAELKAAGRLIGGVSMLGDSTTGQMLDPTEGLGRTGRIAPSSINLTIEDLALEALGESDAVTSDSGSAEASPLALMPSFTPAAGHSTTGAGASTPAPLLSVPPPRSRPLVPIVLGVVAGLVLLYVLFGRGAPEVRIDAPPVAAQTPAPSSTATANAGVKVSLASQPSGAQVSLDGVVIGTTPFDYPVRDRAAGTRLRFDFELAGHVHRVVEAELSGGPMSVTAALEAKPSATPRATPVASAAPHVARRPSPSPSRTAPSPVASATPSASPVQVGIAVEGRRISVDDDSGKVPVVGGVPTVE